MAGMDTPGAPLCAAMAVAVGLLIILDALRAWPLLDGVAVVLPSVVRWVKDRPAELLIQIRSGNAAGQSIRIAPGLPSALSSLESERRLTLPLVAGGSLVWPIRPIRRGRFEIESIAIERNSPWGWWALRARLPVQCEVRVHPDLAAGLRAQTLFLAQGRSGGFAQRQVGKGREFEKLRDYLPGDGSDEIHWKATAKRQQPVTKVYQVERTQEVYVVVDASRLSSRRVPSSEESPREEALLEYELTAALVLGAVAERQGDLFGLATFSDSVHGFVRARNGAAHYAACREMIVGLHPRLVSPDFDELGTFLRLRLRRRALLLFLTSLEDPVAAEGFLRGMDILRQQHLCVVVQPRSPAIAPAFSQGQAGRVRTVTDLYGVLAGHLQWQVGRELDLKLQRRGVTSLQAEPTALASALIQRYLQVKQRQLL